MRDRPWDAPTRHWLDRPEVVAGLDRLAEGSWMGVNDHGVAAVVMNRVGTLGPAPGKRSRGELVLEALDHAEAGEAAKALAELNSQAYRPFNLIIADPVSCYLVCNQGDALDVSEVPSGLHMLTVGDLDDETDPRIGYYLPQFRIADIPDPESGDWQGWKDLLAARLYPDSETPKAAMCFQLNNGFGTRSSSLIALPCYPGFDARPIWLFAGGPPDQADFTPVDF
jgi:hypothetical protein